MGADAVVIGSALTVIGAIVVVVVLAVRILKLMNTTKSDD